jgi:pimeloyl-ACP methyl ester carboxylesterase
VRVRFGVLLAAVGGTLSLGAAEASAALEFCDRADNGRSCATLTVPLDRSGVVPGAVKLRIERQKAKRSARPPLFLIAGEPGQPSIANFDTEMIEDIVGTEARSRDILVMDLRGTGRSGALNCPAIQSGKTAGIAACAASLGSRRDYYTSEDMADDIDAVRSELGVERIALLGVSYGAHVALTYARRHPTRVDRLVLDSPVGPRGIDAFGRSSMNAAPAVLGAQCGKRGCRAFTRDAAADLRRLAGRLERRPMSGLVSDRYGRLHRARLDGDDLLRVMVSEASPILAAAVPGGVRAALRGDAAPLLRTAVFADSASALPAKATTRSAATRLATLCSDTSLPWADTTAIPDRRASVQAALGALPSSAFAPFGRAAAVGEVIEACERWPSPVRRPVQRGALPDVPVLVLSGTFDVRTPVADARTVAAMFPRGYLVMTGAPHGVVIFDSQGCAIPALRRFLAGGLPGQCDGAFPRFAKSLAGPPPRALTDVPPVRGVSGRAGRTLRTLELTIADAYLSLLYEFYGGMASDPGLDPGSPNAVWRFGALRGGRYTASRRGLGFRRASFVPGVRVTGLLTMTKRPSVFRVSGKAAAGGKVVVRGQTLRGRLGGREVKFRFDLNRVLLRAFGIKLARSSPAALPLALSR